MSFPAGSLTQEFTIHPAAGKSSTENSVIHVVVSYWVRFPGQTQKKRPKSLAVVWTLGAMPRVHPTWRGGKDSAS